jgi:hypothetical protein
VPILLIFIARTLLARAGSPPRLFDLFNTLTVAGSLAVLLAGWRALTRRDWLVGLGSGLLIGVLLPFATLFSPYPYFDLPLRPIHEAVIRGLYTTIAMLGGLVIMRWSGPVPVRFALGEWRKALSGLGFGALVGLPLAVLNAFANSWTQGRPFTWQSPLAAFVDALQPGLVEEVLYRLALLGLFWLVLRRAWGPRRAAWVGGLLATLVHNYAHLDDLFVQQPLVALGMGAIMAVIWGSPLLALALRRDLESAVGFHWLQDALRFLAGL